MAYNVVEQKSMSLQLMLKIPPLILVGSLELWVTVRLLNRIWIYFHVCFRKQQV